MSRKYKFHWVNLLFLCWHNGLDYRAVNDLDEGESYSYCPKCKRKIVSVVEDGRDP